MQIPWLLGRHFNFVNKQEAAGQIKHQAQQKY